MARPTVSEGFAYWRDEVAEQASPEKYVPYFPVLALIGVYVAFNENPRTLTSYDWRQTVLASDDAREGLRRSLEPMFKDTVDDDSFVWPVASLRPTAQSALHYNHTYASVKDGLPLPVVGIPVNEEFLANQLGYARYDDSAQLQPLRLSEMGLKSVDVHYPRTAEFIQGNS